MNGANPKEQSKPSGPEKRTDTGRAVYGGGGISPDESVEPKTITLSQRRLLSPTFAFARELVNGRVRGFESNRMANGIDYRHDLRPEEFKVSDSLYKAFRDFVLSDPAFKVTAALLDKNRSFAEVQLRFNIVTAAYGRVTGDRVFIMQDDPQVAKAVDVVPKLVTSHWVPSNRKHSSKGSSEAIGLRPRRCSRLFPFDKTNKVMTTTRWRVALRAA